MSDALPAIVVSDLHLTYPGSPFSLTIDHLAIGAGEAAAIVGPSGSGKSTLLDTLAGIHVPERGTVTVAGTTIATGSSTPTDAARRRFRITSIGFVFQTFELLEHLTVGENVMLPYLVNPALRRLEGMDARARELGAALGIDTLWARHPTALSHGERQRVAIGRALVTEPPVVLADEPTGNLDPETGARTLDLLLEQCRGRGATLVLVTHDHSVLERFDRVVDLAASIGTAS